ncbi:MAG: HAD-IIB family hydrolase [Oscillospiraceae bacterium]|nr:HAD-IIB family hydrolase [Oscillospiraceae bacterium]
MGKTKTLFITDLDGTLLNSNEKITPVTAKIINNLIDKGLIFTYATARSYLTALKVIGDINFKYPAVHKNGVCVQNPKTGDYFEKRIFDKDIISELINKIQDNKFFPMVYAFIDGAERVSWIQGKENDEMRSFLETRRNDKRRRPVNDYGKFYDGEIHNIIFFGKSSAELQKILNILNLSEYFAYHIAEDTYKDEYGNKTYWLEIIRFDATKDFGVKKVKELVGADKIVCFGDNTNDIPMFNFCDEKYAPANAIDEIKNIATGIIDSNDNDGVAKWLEKHARDYI